MYCRNCDYDILNNKVTVSPPTSTKQAGNPSFTGCIISYCASRLDKSYYHRVTAGLQPRIKNSNKHHAGGGEENVKAHTHNTYHNTRLLPLNM